MSCDRRSVTPIFDRGAQSRDRFGQEPGIDDGLSKKRLRFQCGSATGVEAECAQGASELMSRLGPFRDGIFIGSRAQNVGGREFEERDAIEIRLPMPLPEHGQCGAYFFVFQDCRGHAGDPP
jgi:hypothetical protein